jgi:hypothetical protein
MINHDLKDFITKIKEIDTIVDLSLGKVLTTSDSITIFGLTNDLISMLKSKYMDYDNFAEKLKNEFGESLVEEDKGEEDPYNWWLHDTTVEDIVVFLKEYNNK